MRVLCLLACLAVAVAIERPSLAEPPASAAEAEPPSVVRISFARNAAEKLNAIRLRRLVELQLGAELAVDPEPFGPLDENAIRVFIELESETRVLVQAQAPGRKVDSRPVDVEGVPWEVATRFVAITASELVKIQATPPRRPKQREPTPYELAMLEASLARLEVSGALSAGYWGAADELVLGSRLRVAHHALILSEALSLAAYATPAGSVAYEASLAAMHQVWFDPGFRLTPGAGLGLVLNEHPSTVDELSAAMRVHALVEIDARLTDAAWIRFGVEPGFTIEPARDDAVDLWVTGSAALVFEAAP